MKRTTTPVVRVPGFTRDQLREIDRASHGAGLSRASWIRAVALQAARSNPSSVAPKFALAHDRVVGATKPPKATPGQSGGVSGRQPLVRSFDDAEPQDKP